MYEVSSGGDEEDAILQTPTRLTRRVSSVSIGSSSVILGNITDDVLQVWRRMPERIRLDPSVAYMQEQFEDRVVAGDPSNKEYLVVNMSLQHCAKSEEYKEENSHMSDKFNPQEVKLGNIARNIKLVLLICCWIFFFTSLVVTKERVETERQISVPAYKTKRVILNNDVYDNKISITIEGLLLPKMNVNISTYSKLYHGNLSVWLELLPDINKFSHKTSLKNVKSDKNISEVWTLPLLSPELVNIFPYHRETKTFNLALFPEKLENHSIAISIKTNTNTTQSFTIIYDLSPINTNTGIAYGAFILVGLYILIIFEIVHRTIAAVLAASGAVAVLAVMNEKPSMNEVMSWVDVDTLLLLFSMMILVAIIADTGIFDYLAVYAYKITSGKVWPLISTLCLFTAFISSFLDNVTTVMLMTPVTIRLCEVTQLNPVPVLTAMVIFSNIGGAVTPVGDPPNVIIASNKDVIAAGVGFSTFTIHMGIGVIAVLIVVYGHFRFVFRNLEVLRFDEPQDVQDLRHEIAIWQRAAASLSSYSKDENFVRETLLNRVKKLGKELKSKVATSNSNSVSRNYKTTLEELQKKYPIKDKLLLAKSGFCMAFVIICFFLHSSPIYNLSLGWTVFLCVFLLLILADTVDLDGLMARVEWSTLLFFASLFVLMEALTKLGLISWIGEKTEMIIMSVSEESRLAVAILLMLWVSSIAGAFVDNVPLATMMIRIATGLAKNHKLRLPLQPLVWALAFGCCMGGNGTLIGATANVVCAGIAEQHGYRFTFMQFFRMGFPVLLTSTITINIYLMIAYVIFEWNY